MPVVKCVLANVICKVSYRQCAVPPVAGTEGSQGSRDKRLTFKKSVTKLP